MTDLDIPIFKKTYDLYRLLYGYRLDIGKQDRYAIWQRGEDCALDVLEKILMASQLAKEHKLPHLEHASVQLNLLRVFVRLMKDTRVIDNRKYVTIESEVDEVGRMLGGWIRSTKEK
jgi:hypothetical protein